MHKHTIAPDTRQLVIVMVGMPARGKSYTARKISRYLSWRGYRTRVFNVGEYRRERHGARINHDFFDPHNSAGRRKRREVAEAALDDLTGWLQRGGQVALYDATNSTRERRTWVKQQCEQRGFQVLFVDLVCDDPELIETNIRNTKLNSPDYAEMDPDAAVEDFRQRIAHYERANEPLQDDEGSYLRVTNAGQQVVANRVEGYLSARLTFFLVNLHLTTRPIWITRHGESTYNLEGRLGGDPDLTARGQAYAHSLADLLDEVFPDPDSLVVWTSSLRRAGQTANPLARPSMAWRALDEIGAGVCDGMTYAQIEQDLPDEFEARRADKFHYRYPRGESYEDVISRLDPVITELERTRRPVLVIAHQAVLRALYAYFKGVPPQQSPQVAIPLHTVIALQPHAYGCDERRIPLAPQITEQPATSPPPPA
ncbi:MAG: 6-phosphofructo-2-kinase/fructose-2,6-bisphosphatase [Myxococcales bacterium]|jgi:broad specificity phosphatase PhoE/predicted kinase